jgi:hypothetical protein
MNPTLQKAIDRMPTILVKNAPSMIQRMLVAMKAMIAERGHQANASHGMLFLKVGEADLVREFGVVTAQVVDAVRQKIELRRGSPPSLKLEMFGDVDAHPGDTFNTSDSCFSSLCNKAVAWGVIGCEAYDSAVFIKILEQTFEQSRMDRQASAELMPYARQALNMELCKLYSKLESVAVAAGPTPA